MTPNQLYACTAISTSTDLVRMLVGMPELERYASYQANTRIEIRHYADECFDGRRGWELKSVWLDGKPFMVLSGAGRENEDHEGRYITDEGRYHEAVVYIRSLLPPTEREEMHDLVDPDSDLPDMTAFYGHRLEEFFRDGGVNPRWKVGDIVIARVKEDHLRDMYTANPVLVETRVLISAVYPFNPKRTYHGLQLDRDWDGAMTPGKARQMVDKPGEGGVWATFNDAAVVGPGPNAPHHPSIDRVRERDTGSTKG